MRLLMLPSGSRASWERSWPAAGEWEGNGLQAGNIYVLQAGGGDAGRVPGYPECVCDALAKRGVTPSVAKCLRHILHQ